MSSDRPPEQLVRASPEHRAGGTSELLAHQADRATYRHHGPSSARRDHDERFARSTDPPDAEHDHRSRYDENSWRLRRQQRGHAYDSRSDRQQRPYEPQRPRTNHADSRRDTGYSRRYSPVHRAHSPLSRRPPGLSSQGQAPSIGTHADAGRFHERGDDGCRRETHRYDHDRYSAHPDHRRRQSRASLRSNANRDASRKRSRSRSAATGHHAHKRPHDTPDEEGPRWSPSLHHEHSLPPGTLESHRFNNRPQPRRAAAAKDTYSRFGDRHDRGFHDRRDDPRRAERPRSPGDRGSYSPPPPLHGLPPLPPLPLSHSISPPPPPPPRHLPPPPPPPPPAILLPSPPAPPLALVAQTLDASPHLSQPLSAMHTRDGKPLPPSQLGELPPAPLPRKRVVSSMSPRQHCRHADHNDPGAVGSAGGGGLDTPATPATPKHRSPADGIQLYTRISMVGEGTYGKVYKARNKETGQIVALKRMRVDMDREGFPITAMREIRLLKLLRHPNITNVLDVVPESGNAICVVMEYMDYDLSGLINHPQWDPEPAHKKSLMLQLLEGLDFMHTRGILHRDIKGSNLLVNQHGQVKYVDFGLARSFHHTRMQELTNRVITLWYRPPELLLGTTLYGPEVDIWSLGCVILELFTKKPAFQGQNDIDQLEQIFKLLGTPSPAIWESLKKLPWACYMTPNTRYENRLRQMLSTKMATSAVDLISWMLLLDPAARPSAKQCLGHGFFTEAPAPVPPTSFPVSGDWHEYESKAERRKRKQVSKQHSQLPSNA